MNIPVGTFLRERKPRFFEGLDAHDIRTVLAAGTQQRFPANSAIVSQGYPAAHLHLLLTGRARRFFLTENGRESSASPGPATGYLWRSGAAGQTCGLPSQCGSDDEQHHGGLELAAQSVVSASEFRG